VLISLLRKVIPKQVRIASFIIIIATFVTMADYAIQAISLDLYKALGAFIQLIVVNCIILGRAEAYASKNPVGNAFVNAMGMGAGFTFALLCLGIVREVLGSGSLFGIDLFGPSFQPWAVFVLPPGGFFVLAFWLFLFAVFRKRQQQTRLIKEEVRDAA
jgi:electron transport complex protein RnfE